MAWRYLTLRNFRGLNSRQDPRDIGDRLNKLQGMSIDKIGKMKTVGGLTNHSEVPTQGSVVCPGSGLKVYSSDHWRSGTDTIEDLLATDNATADQRNEVESTTGWAATDGATLHADAPADYGIASNSTAAVMRITSAGTNAGATQDITTVIGQRYVVSGDYFLPTGEYGNAGIRFSRVGGGSIIYYGNSPATKDAWTNVTFEFTADLITTVISVEFLEGSASDVGYFDDVYVTPVPGRDMLGDWLALTDAHDTNSGNELHVDLYNDNDDAFRDGGDADGFLNLGTVSSYTGGAGNIDFPTTLTMTDSSNGFLLGGIRPGDVIKISGCSTTTANNKLIVVSRVSADGNTITGRSGPFTVQASEAGIVTLTKYNPIAFHFVNEALRASPVGGGIALRPKHYSFVDRIHFGKDLARRDEYNDWFLNDVGPTAPTDQYVETSDTDGDRDITSDVDAGAGFEIAVTSNTDAGEWAEGTYEVATTFIYDDEQESALYVPSTAQTFTVSNDDSLDIAVRVHNTGTSYNERISGGRAYCRIELSDNPWSLLVDIDMKQGAKATLSGNFNAWAEGATNFVLYSDGFDSFKLNLDSYESLTSLNPSAVREKFSSDNTFWGASVIAGSRCFLFSPRYTAKGGVTSHFADRILYSEAGRYDIFSIDNFIDVVRGDADDYVTGAFWDGRLLAFKQRNLFVIDIRDPDPAGWSLERTFAFRGARLPGAVFQTPYGIAWCNEWGVWLYDGQTVVDLFDNKIDLDDWNTFWTDYTIMGYYAKADLLILMRDCTSQGGSTVPETMIYNFRLGAWTTAQGLFDVSKVYTNFEIDWNQDLIIGEESSGTVTIKKYTDAQTSQGTSKIDWITRDVDFGNPGLRKLIDAIIVTYKSSAGQTTPISYAKDGTESWSTFTGNFTTKTAWATLVIEPTPIECYSMVLRGRNPTNSGTMEINDITFRYSIEDEDIT